MFRILFRVALAYAAYRISREFVQNVPDIESGPDPVGMYQPSKVRRAGSAKARDAGAHDGLSTTRWIQSALEA